MPLLPLTNHGLISDIFIVYPSMRCNTMPTIYFPCAAQAAAHRRRHQQQQRGRHRRRLRTRRRRERRWKQQISELGRTAAAPSASARGRKAVCASARGA